MRGAIAYDDTNLYVAAELTTSSSCAPPAAATRKTTRRSSSRFRAAAALRAARDRSLPGRSGQDRRLREERRAARGHRRQDRRSAQGVPGGYTFEAMIPWSAFPEAARTRVGLRGALRYYDGDGRAHQERRRHLHRRAPGRSAPPRHRSRAVARRRSAQGKGHHVAARRTTSSPTSPATA